ncbi:putative peptide/nitrate transporter [Acorus gramineus]|uniref:Peptide/nitrate transporter n=1 Tax=Acorus gramineus TaxID=55184 RepID=A0AAV9B2S9_ACOGR|nr:putative peptide/nitrate transporter [Acorus gramineus]
MEGPILELLKERVDDGKVLLLQIDVTRKKRTIPIRRDQTSTSECCKHKGIQEVIWSLEPIHFPGYTIDLMYTERWKPIIGRELLEREVNANDAEWFARCIENFVRWNSERMSSEGYNAMRVTAEVEEMNEEMNEKYVDWKGHAVEPTKHDGKKAASFVCVTETLENMVFISNASNLITYFRSYMHYPVAKSANMVTNFMGTSFILTLFGGFVSDSFITRFSTIILFGFIQFIGLVILAVQARSPNLRPLTGKTPSLSQEAMLYVGLYAVSMGVGGVKASLPAHGADQFDSSNKRLVSRYFNWFFFSLCVGGLLAVTVLVWVEENKGWQWGFTICVIAFLLALCIFGYGLPFYRHKVPTGSPFTRIFKVFVSTIQNRKTSVHPIVNPEQLDKKSDARFRQVNQK